MKAPVGYMTLDTYHAIFQGCIPYAVKLNWRGEPLLHPRIAYMVKYAKAIGVREVSMNTNAMLLTAEIIEAFNWAELDWLIISLDGATKHTYESIRLGADFETVVKNIIRASYDFKGKIRLQICPQEANKDELDLWEYLFSQYATEIRVGKLHDPQGKNKLGLDQTKTCSQFWQRTVIDWQGNVYPCCGDFLGRAKLGNVTVTSIRDLWHSFTFNTLRHKLKTYGRKGVTPCKDCTSYC